MARGPRKHLKRLNAPKHWMLDKLTGVFAPRPSTGPHKLRECLPLCIFLRNRLHYALTMDEVKKILQQRITAEEAKYKLCKVKKVSTGQKAVPYLVTHDARTIRYPDPDIKVHDTCVVDIATGKITSHIKFDSGMLCMITGGHNLGRVGVIMHRDRHPGSFDIVHVKDSLGHTFATRLGNVFII